MSIRCKKCHALVVDCAMGVCYACGGSTSSRAYKLCEKCAVRSDHCQLCRGPLKDKQESDQPDPPEKTSQEEEPADGEVRDDCENCNDADCD